MLLTILLVESLVSTSFAQRPCATINFWADMNLHGQLADGMGELEIQSRRHRGILYAVQYWECLGKNHMIHDIVSASDDGSTLALTYVYSKPMTGEVNYAYIETTMSSKTVGFSASGKIANSTTCPPTAGPLPQWIGRTTPKPIGLEVRGPKLYIGPNGQGWAMMADHIGIVKVFNVTAFSVVDCTDCPKECPSDLHPSGWFELHVTLTVPRLAGTPRTACFAIVYLYHDDPSMVEVTLSVCWPQLDPLPAKFFRSPWTQLNSTLIFQ